MSATELVKDLLAQHRQGSLHVLDGGDVCIGCGSAWPCNTVQTINRHGSQRPTAKPDAAQAAPDDDIYFLPAPNGWFTFGTFVDFGWLDLEQSTELAADGLPLWERPMQRPVTDTETEQIANVVEERLDREVHDDLCACDNFPATCVTYGDKRPWAHSDVDRVVRTTIDVIRAGRSV